MRFWSNIKNLKKVPFVAAAAILVDDILFIFFMKIAFFYEITRDPQNYRRFLLLIREAVQQRGNNLEKLSERQSTATTQDTRSKREKERGCTRRRPTHTHTRTMQLTNPHICICTTSTLCIHQQTFFFFIQQHEEKYYKIFFLLCFGGHERIIALSTMTI